MLNCALEALVRHEVLDFGAYVEKRKEIFDEEFYGKTNSLLQTLKTELDRIDNHEV